MESKSLEEYKNKLIELEIEMFKYYQLYKKYEKEIYITKMNFQKECNHIWEIDSSYYDDRTVYTCKLCGK